ncbi:MAG: histidine phosphatase family protein [Candidatus Woesearchaeota archaeon]
MSKLNYYPLKPPVIVDAAKLNFLLYRSRYLIRYILIGLGSLILESTVIEFLNGTLNPTENESIIRIIGFLLGVLFAFKLNSKINFPVSRKRNFRTFRIFLLISIFSFCINLGIINYASDYIRLGYSPMRFLTAAIIFIFSYTLHKRFTFTEIKKVGIALYLTRSEKIPSIKLKVKYPDFIHIDLIDNSYNSSAEEVYLPAIKEINNKWPSTEKMVHIMSRNPSKWIMSTQRYADYIIFHVDCDENISDLITACKKLHKKVGLSLLYNTDIKPIIKYLHHVDIVQILGIEVPGRSNQHLNERALDKLNELNKLKHQYDFELCFDGGIKLTNIKKINAKYIVSASTVLESMNPIKTIYDLKTSSKYYQNQEQDLKQFIYNKIKSIIESKEFIISGTIVGSFIEEPGIRGISDIDVVIIVDKLTKKKFENIVEEFEKSRNILKTDFDYNLIINTKFGPLKYNDKKTAVLHLMIYDIQEHIDHCRNSPFTCLDWTRSKHYFKMPLNYIYNLPPLQPNDFFNARRSITDYSKDLDEGAISYREYIFNKKISQIKKKKPMENKDRFEYAYHIMKFCMANLIKLHDEHNENPKIEELAKRYFRLYPLNKSRYIPYLVLIARHKRKNLFPEWAGRDQALLKGFLSDFKMQFDDTFTNSKKVYFMRHHVTKMNLPNIFIGQKSNPDIIGFTNNEKLRVINLLKNLNISAMYSSPSNRSLQTINPLMKELGIKRAIIDYNLCEIDYGDIDGKNYDFLKKNHPKIIEEWKNNKDPRFPGGENYNDILKRIDEFMSEISEDNGNSLVCTHNVFMRSLIGSYYNIPQSQWHDIEIPHIEPIEFIFAKNRRYYINLSADQISRMFKKIDCGA